MAPKRKRPEIAATRELEVRPTSRVGALRRVTRSLTSRTAKDGSLSAAAAAASSARKSPAKKKGKQPRKTPEKTPKKTAKKEEVEEEDDDSKKKGKKPRKSPAKKPKKTVKKEEAEAEEEAEEEEGDASAKNAEESETEAKGAGSSSKPNIIIEHCKQCQSFKKRANEAKEGLEKRIPGINVSINPDKPRRGCFEIRAEGGKVYVDLKNLKRPFKKMKDLDMDEVVEGIVKDIEE